MFELIPGYKIDNEEKFIRNFEFQFFRQKTISIEAIQSFISKGEAFTFSYFDAALNYEDSPQLLTEYVWIDSGYVNDKGEPLFISLLDLGTGEFIGNVVGTPKFLAELIRKRHSDLSKAIGCNLKMFCAKYNRAIANRKTAKLEPIALDDNGSNETKIVRATKASAVEDERIACVSVTSEESFPAMKIGNKEIQQIMHSIVGTTNVEEPEAPKVTAVVETPVVAPKIEENTSDTTPIVSQLLQIMLYNPYKTEKGLEKYLDAIGCRLKNLMKKGNEDELVDYQSHSKVLTSASSDAIVVNSGLLDLFGEEIYLCYENYTVESVVSNKMLLLRKGFNRDEARMILTPFRFIRREEHKATDLCNALESMSFLDFKDILDEKCDETISEDTYFDSTQMSLAIAKLGNEFIKKFYDPKQDCVIHVLPVFVKNPYSGTPDYAAIYAKGKCSFIPFTNEYKDTLLDTSLTNSIWEK